ncbi:hypothetical protein P7C70_g4392, partial [Phenoliferia sp. Uapishka_3]
GEDDERWHEDGMLDLEDEGSKGHIRIVGQRWGRKASLDWVEDIAACEASDMIVEDLNGWRGHKTGMERLILGKRGPRSVMTMEKLLSRLEPNVPFDWRFWQTFRIPETLVSSALALLLCNSRMNQAAASPPRIEQQMFLRASLETARGLTVVERRGVLPSTATGVATKWATALRGSSEQLAESRRLMSNLGGVVDHRTQTLSLCATPRLVVKRKDWGRSAEKWARLLLGWSWDSLGGLEMLAEWARVRDELMIVFGHKLQGHLVLVHPTVLPLTDDFFNPPSHMNISSETQLSAFQSSPLPALLDAVAPGPQPTSSVPDSDVKPTQPLPTASLVDDRMSTGEPSGWSPVGQSPPITLGPGSTSLGTLSLSQRKVLGIPTTNPHSFSRLPSSGLQTLANAAAKDSDFGGARYDGLENTFDSGRKKMAGVEDGLAESESPHKLGEQALPVLLLPSEAVRNQLVDLYFNQIVHPSYPMVDKARFFRWTAHLPAKCSLTSRAAGSLPPELYLAVFAVVTPYLTSSAAATTHTPEVFASAARAHLFASLDKPSVETVQACCLLALSDWGLGELNRAWTLSSLAIALSINLSLHITKPRPDGAPRPESETSPSRLRTFHSALIIHALLSLRLLRPPMSVLEDYDVPVPPQDGPENFELWRSDKSPEELRTDHGLHAGGGGGPPRHMTGGQRIMAVRSCALSTFSNMASLCAIGLSIVRWGVCPRRGNGGGLAAGEQEREGLVASLGAWEKDLPPDLRLSEQSRGVEQLHERSRHTVEMHLLLFTLYMRLTPHISFQTRSYDPVPQAIAMNSHILARYLDLFSFYRSTATIELSLHVISGILFTRSDYSPHQHDVPIKAYEELASILPVAANGIGALKERVEQVRSLRQIKQRYPDKLNSLALPVHLPHRRSVPSPTTTIPSPAPPSPAPFLDLSLFQHNTVPDPILWENVSQWDQTDLLVSLGLVSDPTQSHPWQPPPAVDSQNSQLQPQFQNEEGMGNSSQVYGYDLHQQQQSTDLLTRWLDRGTMGFGLDDQMI